MEQPVEHKPKYFPMAYLTPSRLEQHNQCSTFYPRSSQTRMTFDRSQMGKARVVKYEDLEKERAVRAVNNAKTSERMVKKAAKVAKNVANAILEAEEAATGKTMRGRKRKSTASAAAPRAKTARISDALVAEVEDEAGASEPQAKAARTSKRLETPSSTVAFAEMRSHWKVREPRLRKCGKEGEM
ncbi:hypothetical protein T440DRAFT_473376 [Plenodomus tracheiphilus IPT5]|uniref:Uncharacterized protein n=1 Tax=Plenodomus tracheiphilus IPT5 TaxID=1408161 RepID=A0A6A7AN40_9PLEO|nr:hypothetical protein T440DRAFT_473376 [Plenodomus tracheiphilus IPT5]